MILVLVPFALWPSLPLCPVCSHFLMLLSSLTSFSPSLSPGAITPQQHSWLPFPVSLSSLSIIHSSVHTAALPPFVSHLLSLCRRDSSHFRPLSLLFLAAVPVFEEVGAWGNNGGGTGQVFDNMSSRDKKLQQWEGETQE